LSWSGHGSVLCCMRSETLHLLKIQRPADCAGAVSSVRRHLRATTDGNDRGTEEEGEGGGGRAQAFKAADAHSLAELRALRAETGRLTADGERVRRGAEREAAALRAAAAQAAAGHAAACEEAGLLRKQARRAPCLIMVHSGGQAACKPCCRTRGRPRPARSRRRCSASPA